MDLKKVINLISNKYNISTEEATKIFDKTWFDMENAKEIKINIPEGHEIDKEKSTFEKIVFKRIEQNKPKSWKEYLNIFKLVRYTPCNIQKTDENKLGEVCSSDYFYDAFNTEEEAKAFCALGKLIQLRDAWCDGWRADWADVKQSKFAIYYIGNQIIKGTFTETVHILVFPTAEIRNEFLETFKYLIEEAKMFL